MTCFTAQLCRYSQVNQTSSRQHTDKGQQGTCSDADIISNKWQCGTPPPSSCYRGVRPVSKYTTYKGNNQTCGLSRIIHQLMVDRQHKMGSRQSLEYTKISMAIIILLKSRDYNTKCIYKILCQSCSQEMFSTVLFESWPAPLSITSTFFSLYSPSEILLLISIYHKLSLQFYIHQLLFSDFYA